MNNGFTINVIGDVIRVHLEGEWNLSQDIEYTSSLAAAFKEQQRPFGLVVDMRDWHLPMLNDDTTGTKIAKVHLDRTNQVFECWIVRHEMQALQLQSFVKKIPDTHFYKVLSEEDAENIVCEFHEQLPSR